MVSMTKNEPFLLGEKIPNVLSGPKVAIFYGSGFLFRAMALWRGLIRQKKLPTYI
jgi:hypothetical protein